MQTSYYKYLALFLLTLGNITSLYGDTLQLKRVRVEDRSLPIYDIQTIQNKDWTKLPRIPEHPAFDSLLTSQKEMEILAEVNGRRRELGKDTLLTSDLFYVWRPYFDWLYYEDPHLRVTQRAVTDKADFKNSKALLKQLKVPAFSYLWVNDTIVIDQSLDTQFKKGDMVVSVNGLTIPEYLKYTYSDRYGSFMWLYNYHFSLAVDTFKVSLVRDGKPLELETGGQPLSKVLLRLDGKDVCRTKVFENEKCGYVEIKEFYPNNKVLIKKLHAAINGFKSRGYTNVILDLRKNPGGNGHFFDKLMSIFISKPTVPYQGNPKLMVSKETVGDYDFLTEDMIGKTLAIPKEHYVASFATDPEMYVDGMTYYVLISANTGSTAASFVNLLQYNDAAQLVGEPLLHNALRYGEIIEGKKLMARLYTSAISTTEVDEYTKAVNGYLTPDIHIPYVAKDYLTGKDAMLEKLLAIIYRNTK